MGNRSRQSLVRINTSQKIRKIIESPHLPVLVDSMSSRSLSELIDQAGVENSHAIMKCASNAQIKAVLDIQLWQSQPGKTETLRVDDFFPWLEIWNDLGAEFVVEKLKSLGVEFIEVYDASVRG